MLMHRLAALVAAFLPAAIVLGDIAPSPLMTGGTSLATSNKQTPVAMLWEEVDLRPSAARNEVEAVFRLKNTSDAATELEVGFPSYFEKPLQDFKADVDGETVAAAERKEGPAGPKKLFTYWMCWQMSFAPGQEKTVKVSYWVRPESQQLLMVVSGDGSRSINVIDSDFLPEDLRNAIGARESGYVLRTGRGWHGPIGRAVVRLHHGEGFARDRVTRLVPAQGWSHDNEKGVATLALTNVEPDEAHDIAYEWRLTDQTTEVAKAAEALAAKKLSPEAMQNLASVIGYQFRHVKRAAPTAEQLKILCAMVAPLGPELGEKALADYSLCEFYRVTYTDVLAHYAAAGQKDAQAACAAGYVKILDAAIAQRHAQMKQIQGPSDEKILNDQIAALKAQRDEAAKLAGEAAAQ